MDLERQKGKGAETKEGDVLTPTPPVQPKGEGEPESPRSIGATIFSDPFSRASGSYAP